MTSPDAIKLTVRERAEALLDDPFDLRATVPDGAELRWRGRIRDDDGRVWRASAGRAHELSWRWMPAKDGTGPIAALASLRPVSIDVRVETEDGRGAARTLRRQLVVPGVKSRRWRGEVAAVLHLPAAEVPASTLLIDATASEAAATVAALAGPLLAARGVLTLVVPPPKRATPDLLDRALEQLAAVPAVASAGKDPLVLPARPPRLPGEVPPDAEDAGGGDTAGGSDAAKQRGSAKEPGSVEERGATEARAAAEEREPAEQRQSAEDVGLAVVLPPNVPAREPGPEHTRRRVATWDGLLAHLGARGR